MGATHFKMRTLKNVAIEMALHILAYNMKRVIAIIGATELVKAIASLILQFVAIIASKRAVCRSPMRFKAI